jgi:dTMP kinase
MPRGSFIAMEGIDGAGKRTQLELLARWLADRGVPHARISFPRYDSFFGRLVGQFLDGRFGKLDQVDPHFSALLYAGDRLDAKSEMNDILQHQSRILIADRYVGSNLAHQTARCAPAQRDEFLRWLKELEYRVYGLPVEDLVVYLRVPAAVAHRQVAQKTARDYTARSHDLQEADLRHLQDAATVYDQLAGAPNWVTVECCDARGALRSPEAIHADVVRAVEKLEGIKSGSQEVRR